MFSLEDISYTFLKEQHLTANLFKRMFYWDFTIWMYNKLYALVKLKTIYILFLLNWMLNQLFILGTIKRNYFNTNFLKLFLYNEVKKCYFILNQIVDCFLLNFITLSLSIYYSKFCYLFEILNFNGFWKRLMLIEDTFFFVT